MRREPRPVASGQSPQHQPNGGSRSLGRKTSAREVAAISVKESVAIRRCTNMARRTTAVLLAAAIGIASAFAALLGSFWGFALTCDDSCGTPPPWRDDPEAWQWDALGAASLAAFAMALLFVVAIALRRRVIASGALVAWIVAASVFLNLFRDSGLTSSGGRGWAGLTVLAIAGLASVALARPRQGD